MIDENLKDDEDLLDGYQGKWMNIYFLKTGESWPGESRHNTECAAIKYGEEWIHSWDGVLHRLVSPYISSRVGRQPLSTEVSHFISMPIGG